MYGLNHDLMIRMKPMITFFLQKIKDFPGGKKEKNTAYFSSYIASPQQM